MSMVVSRRTMAMGLTVLMIFGGLAAAPPAGASSETVSVTASVGPYAELTCGDVDATLTLPPFTGEPDEQQYKEIQCTMVSNTLVNLHVTFQSLSHDDDNDVKLPTALLLEGGKPNKSSVRLLSPLWDEGRGGPPAGGGAWYDWQFGTNATLENVQESGSADYTLRVWGRLGDVDRQLAGTYSTEVVLTVSFNQ